MPESKMTTNELSKNEFFESNWAIDRRVLPKPATN